MNTRQNRKTGGSIASLLVLCLVLFALGGCKGQAVSSAGPVVVEKEYTQGQLMVIGATERNRYQNVYTSRLWSVTAGDGSTFEEKLKAQMEQFLVELATINLMAEEQGMELTGQEKDEMKALSQEYYDGLTDQDKAYMQVSKDEVYDLYCQYFLADKFVTSLTEKKNLEISDAEAKVIQIQQIQLDTQEDAEAVLLEAMGEKADFAAIASKNSKDSQITFTIEWNEEMDSLEQSAFSLEQDQISSIVEQDGKFYIQKCTNSYDAEATAQRKARLTQEKKTKEFLNIYEPYVKTHTVKLKEGVWEKVDFAAGQDCTSENFFQLYQDYLSKRKAL